MDKTYENLALYFTEVIYNNADQESQDMYKQQKQNQDDLLDHIAKALLSYTILDNVLSLSGKEIAKLRKDFIKIINIISVNEFKNEKVTMESIFRTSTKDKYYTNAYVMNIGVNFRLKKLTDEQIKQVVNNTLKNEVWSDRLWNNKKELENSLKIEIEKFLHGKTNVNNIQKVIKNKFNQNAYNTRRLVQTEVARCQNEVNDVFAKEHGIKNQMFTATLDSRTSDFCREHDGEIYSIDDPGKPYLPHHPFERSCYINVPFKEWKPDYRIDNETKNIINYKKYNDWVKDKS